MKITSTYSDKRRSSQQRYYCLIHGILLINRNGVFAIFLFPFLISQLGYCIPLTGVFHLNPNCRVHQFPLLPQHFKILLISTIFICPITLSCLVALYRVNIFLKFLSVCKITDGFVKQIGHLIIETCLIKTWLFCDRPCSSLIDQNLSHIPIWPCNSTKDMLP